MKISGRVVSTKPIPVNRAAKLISRFAAVENGSSPAVSLYLERTSHAFNHLIQSNKEKCSESQKEMVKYDGDDAVAKKRKRK